MPKRKKPRSYGISHSYAVSLIQQITGIEPVIIRLASLIDTVFLFLRVIFRVILTHVSGS